MSVVVVGDVLLDVDLLGRSDRLSPDAPVPVVDVEETVLRPGGAGLVARMLAADGLDVQLVTVLSDDERSGQLRSALEGVDVVAGASNGPTPVKTRVRAAGHAVVRVDEGCDPPAEPTVTDAMVAVIAAADVVLVADYGRGVAAHPRLRDAIAARSADVPVVWDPHPRGAEPVPGTTVVTPNLSEATLLAQVRGSGIGAAHDAATRLQHLWGVDAVVVTLGARGALLVADPAGRHGDAAGPVVIPAPGVEASDPCGAGDRLAASLAVALLDGARLPDAVDRAVRAASTFLAGGGVAGLAARGVTEGSPAAEAVPIGGTAADALDVARRTRAAGGTVVATGGCFDLLHAGHARTLAAARKLGDCLVVCLNSDASVRRLKGSERPIIGQEDRVALLLALECVDAVLVFDEDSPEDALSRLRPDVWVKGGDYRVEELPEAELVRTWGGCTVTVPFHAARSTSLLANALARVS